MPSGNRHPAACNHPTFWQQQEEPGSSVLCATAAVHTSSILRTWWALNSEGEATLLMRYTPEDEQVGCLLRTALHGMRRTSTKAAGGPALVDSHCNIQDKPSVNIFSLYMPYNLPAAATVQGVAPPRQPSNGAATPQQACTVPAANTWRPTASILERAATCA